jgi:hypothetical protein
VGAQQNDQAFDFLRPASPNQQCGRRQGIELKERREKPELSINHAIHIGRYTSTLATRLTHAGPRVQAALRLNARSRSSGWQHRGLDSASIAVFVTSISFATAIWILTTVILSHLHGHVSKLLYTHHWQSRVGRDGAAWGSQAPRQGRSLREDR